MIQRMYDPDSGWKYGFPKPFNPEPGSAIEETLLKDGYPQKLIDYWSEQGVPIRFWDQEIPSCPKCGSQKLSCPNGHTWPICET